MDPYARCSLGMPSAIDYQQYVDARELNTCTFDPVLLGGKEFGSEQDLDALLANAGYAVKASDLEHVAGRLEQLESVLVMAEEAGISRLSGEAVHKNPSDLASWVESMIHELAPCVGPAQPHGQLAMGEFAFEEDFASWSIDSQLDQRDSYLADLSVAQQQASGTMCSTIDEGAVGVSASTSYCMRDTSGKALLEELAEGFQYKDDEARDNFSDGLQSVFPEGMDYSHGDMRLPQPSRPFAQPEQLSSSTYQLRDGARTPSSSTHESPLGQGAIRMLSEPQQPIQSGNHFRRFPSCEQMSVELGDGDDVCHPVICDAVTLDGGQESGVLLVRLLMACAEAVQSNDRLAANELVREIQKLAITQSGAMAKVASHFANALGTRISGSNSPSWQSPYADSWAEFLYFHFYETCPYLKFAHFTANQAILEAFEGRKIVHVIDFNLMQGLQWPALIQALALRPGGPPRLRLTGIGPPQPDDTDVLQEIGMKLAQLADSVDVEFDFRGVLATKVDDVKPWMLQVQPGETVAVNSILQLHRLLSREGSIVDPIDEVLRSVRSLNPQIITVVEQEANHNSSNFLERFVQALQYYCTMFDSLEACSLPPQSSEVALTEMYLGREIANVVACEGLSRVERHETLAQWRERMAGAGFMPSHLGSNAFKQASMLLTLFSGEGYTVEENSGCLTLGWHSRPLIAASAWKCG